jgi:hypothetical protein
VEQDQAGTFTGRENRVFPREIELALFGQVDPYARATVILEAAEEFEDGQRALEFGLAEAYLELTSLPFGFGAKGGRERLRFGLLNELHLHDRPQADSPDVLTVFFGEEGLTEDSLEVPPARRAAPDSLATAPMPTREAKIASIRQFLWTHFPEHRVRDVPDLRRA